MKRVFVCLTTSILCLASYCFAQGSKDNSDNVVKERHNSDGTTTYSGAAREHVQKSQAREARQHYKNQGLKVEADRSRPAKVQPE